MYNDSEFKTSILDTSSYFTQLHQFLRSGEGQCEAVGGVKVLKPRLVVMWSERRLLDDSLEFSTHMAASISSPQSSSAPNLSSRLPCIELESRSIV